jgi:hypothetical protein
VEAAAKSLGKTVESLASQTGKSKTEIVDFTKSFNTLKTDAEKLRAAIGEFGFTLGTQLFPELKKAGTELTALEQQSKAVSESFSSMVAPIGAAVAGLAILVGGAIATGAALVKLTTDAASWGDEIYRAHLKTQLSTESLSGIRVAMKENHVEFSVGVSAIDRYLKNLDNAALGNKKLRLELSELGIKASELRGNPQAAVEALIKAWSEIGPTADRNQVAITLLGKGGDQLIPVLDALKGSFGDVMKRAAELGELWDLKTAKQAHDLEVSVADLSTAWEGLKLSIGKQLFEEVTYQIENLTKAVKDNREEVASSAPGVVEWIEIILDSARRLADLIGGVLVGAFGLIQMLLTPIINLAYSLVEVITLIWQGISSLFSPKEAAATARYREELEKTRVVLTSYVDTLLLAANLLGGVFGASPFAHTLESDLAADERQRKDAAAEKARQRSRLAPLSQDTSAADERERKKTEKEALKNAQEDAKARLQVLTTTAREQQRTLQEQEADERRSYEARTISLREFVSEQQRSAQKLLESQLSILQAERDEIDQSELTGRDKVVKLADNFAKQREAYTVFHKTIEQLNLEAQKKERDALDAHHKALLDIYDVRDKALIASIQDAAKGRVAAAEQTESTVLSIERAGMDRRDQLLQAELAQAGKNAEERQKVNDKIARQAQERVSFEEDAFRRVSQARLKDIENLRAYREEIDKLQEQGRAAELANIKQRFDDLKKGAATIEDLTKLQVEFERSAEAERNRLVEERLERQRFYNVELKRDALGLLDLERRGEEQLAEVERGHLKDFQAKLEGYQRDLANAKAQGKPEEEQAGLRDLVSISESNVVEANKHLRETTAHIKELDNKVSDLKLSISTAVEEADQKDTDAANEHLDNLAKLTSKEEAVIISGSNRLLATREEIIKKQFEIQRAAEAQSYEQAKRGLENEKGLLEARRKFLREEAQLLEERGDTAGAQELLKQADELDTKIKALKRQLDALEAHYRATKEKTKNDEEDTLDRADPSSQRSRFGDKYADSFTAIKDAAEKAGKPITDFKAHLYSVAVTAEDAFSKMSESAGNMDTMLSGAFGNIVQGLGSMLEAFLTTGSLSVKALEQMLIATLAHLAAEAFVKALMETAAGYASLAALDPATAALHFAAAHFYGIVAAVSAGGALVGRAAFGGALNSAGQSQGAGSYASGGGQNQPTAPQYAPFVYNQNQGTGSSGIGLMNTKLIMALERNTAAVGRLQSMPAGDVVTVGAHDAREAIGAAVVSHSGENHDFNQTMLRNYGFAQ